jgi:hypothetical protein
MSWRRTSTLPELAADDCNPAGAWLPPTFEREECLEQILRAFRDIADRDDIHQAAERLRLAQRWIDKEAKRAAADPIFAGFRLV